MAKSKTRLITLVIIRQGGSKKCKKFSIGTGAEKMLYFSLRRNERPIGEAKMKGEKSDNNF